MQGNEGCERWTGFLCSGPSSRNEWIELDGGKENVKRAVGRAMMWRGLRKERFRGREGATARKGAIGANIEPKSQNPGEAAYGHTPPTSQPLSP